MRFTIGIKIVQNDFNNQLILESLLGNNYSFSRPNKNTSISSLSTQEAETIYMSRLEKNRRYKWTIRKRHSSLFAVSYGTPNWIADFKRLHIRLPLGKPTFQKSAVFFNIVQKAFDPPPLLFEHLSYFAGGVFQTRFWAYEIYVAPHI